MIATDDRPAHRPHPVATLIRRSVIADDVSQIDQESCGEHGETASIASRLTWMSLSKQDPQRQCTSGESLDNAPDAQAPPRRAVEARLTSAPDRSNVA